MVFRDEGARGSGQPDQADSLGGGDGGDCPRFPCRKQRAEYGTIQVEPEPRGEMIGNNDLWIAAHAVAARLTLVTNNEREFRRVRGLKIQNWAL